MGICFGNLKKDVHIVPATQETPPKAAARVIPCSTQEDIQKYYQLEKVIGFGVFGTVRKGYLKSIPTRKVAIKSINKRKFEDSSEIQRLKREMQILQVVDHPNIIKLYDVFEDATYIHVVIEYCEGGELFAKLMQRGKYNELDAAKVLQSILRAVQNLHLNHISHRDLKPENFLFESLAEDSELKLIDFGLSSKFGGALGTFHTMESMVGTPYYIAPEVLYGPNYGPECDLWSVGVIMYVLLTGLMPFTGGSQEEIFFKVKSGLYSKEGAWETLSEQAQDLISKLIVLRPQERITAEGALKHQWVALAGEDHVKVDPKILKTLRSYRIFSDLQREALAVLVKYLSFNEIKELKEAFTQMDTDNSGYLTLDEIEEALHHAGCSNVGEELKVILSNATHRNSGRIDYSEFLAATLTSKMEMKEEFMWNAFKHFDVKNSGFITPENLVVALRKTGRNLDYEDAKRMIEEVNNDQKVSYRQFKKMLSTVTIDSNI